MTQPIVLNRTTNPNAVPPTALEGEPAVCIAPVLTRFWIGDGVNNRLLLSSNPNDPLGPAIGTGSFLPLSGGTMAGAIETMPPVGLQDAVNKVYVDTSIAALRSFIGTWSVAANTPDISGGAPTPGDYHIAVTVNPNVPETAPPGIPGIAGQTIENGDIVIWDAGASVWELIRGGPLTVAEANAFYIQKTGDTMTGPLVLAAFPTLPMEAVAKNYVDDAVAYYLPLTGGILTGQLTVNSGLADALIVNGAPNQDIVQFHSGSANAWFTGNASQMILRSSASLAVNSAGNLILTSAGAGSVNLIAGGTGTVNIISSGLISLNGSSIAALGPLNLIGDPATALQAATKQYVDDAVAGVPLTDYLPLAGGTLSGGLGFGSANGAGTTLTRHLMLYGTTYGMNATAAGGGIIRYVVPAGASHQLYVGTFQVFNISGPASSIYCNWPIVLDRDPQFSMEASTKQYVDNAVAAAMVQADGVSIVGDGSAGNPLRIGIVDGGVF